MTEDLSYIDALDLLISTGIKNISESGSEINFSCPSPEHFHGDHSPSARMNSRTTAWLCFSCGQRGNAVTFLSWYKRISYTEARRLLEERYGGGRISAEVGGLYEEVFRIMNPPPEIVEQERIPPAESWLEFFHIDWENGLDSSGGYGPHIEYMFDRGFSAQILREWDIGYDDYSHRITIPIRDHTGKLVGFKGRAIEDDIPYPRYLPLGDTEGKTHYGFQPYQKSKYVFGLDRYIKEYDWREDRITAVIVEGEFNCIAMNQHGFGYHAIAIAGSEFSEIQVKLIGEYCDDVILYLDNDKAGDKGAKRVIEMLSPYMPLRVVQNAPGDAAELDSNTVKDLITSARPALELAVEGII